MAENVFAWRGDPVQYCFFDFHQVKIWVDREAEILIARISDPLKHRFINLAEIAFWVV
jgi:hypothetical protein